MEKEQQNLEENTTKEIIKQQEIEVSDEDLSSGSDEEQEIIIKKVKKQPEVVKNETIIEELPKPTTKPKKKYVKAPPKIVKTSDPEVNVVLRSKNKGTRPKKQIVIYKEDLEEYEDKPEIIVKSRTKGRPKKKKIIKYVDEFGNEVANKEEANEVVLPLPGKQKELSEKDLKIIELETRLTELSNLSNKNIRGTKKGKPDQRQIKPRSEKQIAQAKRLVEMNKLKRLEKQKTKDEELKQTQKSAVKEVITELSNVKKEAEKKEEEIKQKIVEEKKTDLYYNDPLFS